MKTIAIFTAIYLIASSQAATNYLIKAGPGNQCESGATYNQCIDNGLVTTCAPTDNVCNCKQAQILAACVNYCTRDPSIAGLGATQQGEVTKWCNAAASASASPSSASPSIDSSKPTASQLASTPPSNNPANSSPTTSPSGGTGSTNSKSVASKAQICMGLLGVIGLVSYLV
ncbi:hypothetical protein K7432_004242 [Basidiobolus ranarum]|uniref:Uncharacterized protein n=1 Tax=Basidiobolus ranarum TaxID=34480 RepID=A0ABR2WYM6_9FUNG